MSDELNLDEPAPSRAEVASSASETRGIALASVGRVLPHSLESEEGVLSTLLIDPDGIIPLIQSAGLTPDSFFAAEHAIVLRAVLSLHRQSQPVSVDTVAMHLRDTRQLDSLGGFPFLLKITSRQPTTAQARFFIDRVREQSILRNLIRSAAGVLESAFNFSGGIEEFAAEAEDRMKSAVNGYAGRNLPVRNFSTFAIPPPKDPSILVGNRWLSRGDIAVLASSSGMGKSSLSLQVATLWALGRDFHGGLAPNGPQKSLFIQSEDSDGDIAEVQHSLFHSLNLTDREIATVAKNVLIVTDRIHRGPSFHVELKRLIALHHPDIIFINPLLAFIGGDVNDAEAAGAFIRDGLNSLNEPPTHAYVVVHHTTKPPKERQNRRWSEVMYDMAGSADLTNAARAIISLRPTETPGQFNMVMAKRGVRAGFTVPSATGVHFTPATTIGLRHSKERMRLPDGRDLPLIFWELCAPSSEDAEPKVRGGRPPKYTIQEFLKYFPKLNETPLPAGQIWKALQGISGIGETTFKDLAFKGAASGAIELIKLPNGSSGYRRVDHPSSESDSG